MKYTQKKFVRTMIGLTTVMPTPVPLNSCFKPSENPNIANFDVQYDAIPGKPKIAATDTTFTIWPDFSLSSMEENF